MALANDGIVPELVHAISILNHFVGVDAAGNAIRFALQNRMEYRNAISCLIKAKMMEKNGHLLVDSKLIEDYQMSSPVSANGQIAATRWKGKPAFFSIGSDSDVYFTFRDPDQPAGWREEKLGLKAKLIAATWSEATGPLLFSYDDVYSKDPAYGSDSLRWIHLCWKPETESKWLVQKLAYGFDCKKLVARTLNGEVYLSCVGMDPKVQGDQPYQVSSTRFVGFSTGFRAAAILTDSLNFDFGRNAKGEVGLYILFSPRAYFQSPTACEKVFQDEGNKGTAKNQNLMMWRPKTTGTQKVFGYFAEGGTYHDAPPKYSHGNIRLVAQVLEDPSNSGLLPPVAKKITAWKKVYDTHNTTTSNHMDFSLLQPDLDAAALKDYVPLGCIGLKNMDPSAKDYPEVYALHQDHAVQGTFYDLKTEENGTIYVYSDNQEAGNKLDIWYTGNCEPDKSKGKKCTSVSHILPRYGVSGLDIGGFWARKGIDDVPTNLQNAAYCPAAQPPKKSILLFTPMSASGYFELGQRWEALNLNGHFEGLSLAVLNREGKASELFVCTADGSLCKVSEPDSKGIRQLKAVPVHKKVAFLECQVEQGNIGGYHLFGITKDRHLFQTAVATGDAPGTMLPLFEQDERVSGFDTFLDADGNCGAFSLLQQPESHAMQFLLHDGHSGNWTIQPLHASNANPVLQEIRAFSVQITALDPDDFPWANRNLRIWTEESALIKVNGKSFYAGPNDPVSMKTGQDGRCRISVPTNTLFAPVIHVHADFMDTGDEFVTISPNADLQLKLKNLERDGGLAAAKKNPLHGNPEPLFGSEQANNLDQVGKYLSESMKLLPAIDYAADLRYLRLNREIPDQPNPKTAAARKPKKFGRLSPTPNMRFGLKFENGRATFLQGEETLSPNAMAKSATEWFEGAWGDVWHFVKQAGTAIQDGFLIVIDTLTDGIRATLNFVINGITYAYKGVANLVQEVFGMVEGVFSAIGAAFEDLVAWLGYLFDWDDILRTQRAFEAVTNRSLTHLQEGLRALEQYLVTQLHDARGSMDAAFAELSKQVVHQEATLSKANEQQPGATTSDSVMSQNIVFNGMLDNAHTAPAPQAPAGENIFAKIIDDLSAELSSFADSPELKNLAATLKSASFTPQNFVDVALPAIFRAIQTMLDAAFDIAETLLKAMLEKLIEIVGDILAILDMPWDIPLVSNLYAKISGGQRLSFLNLACLIVAVPATPLYKIAVGKAPFADEAAFNEFMDAFGFDSPQKAKRTALAAANKEVSQATLDKWQPVMRSLLLLGQGVTTFFAILPDSVLAAAPPPPVKIPEGEAAPLIPKPDPLDDYRKSLGNTNYLTPLSWISTILSALNHAAGIPINLLNPNVKILDKFSPQTSSGRANLVWAVKWIKIGSNTYSLWTSGYKLQETSAWGAIADMLMALGSIGMNIYKEVKRDERQWLDFLAKSLLELPNVFAFLKTKYFTTISPPGTSLLIYAGMQGTCKTVSFGLTFARWALLLNEKTDDLPEDQMTAK